MSNKKRAPRAPLGEGRSRRAYSNLDTSCFNKRVKTIDPRMQPRGASGTRSKN